MNKLIAWIIATIIYSLLILGMAGDFGQETKKFATWIFLSALAFGVSYWWKPLIRLIKRLWAERNEE